MPRVKLRRIGNSIGLTLPKEYVKDRRLKAGDEVEIDVAKAVTIMDVWGQGKRFGVSADEAMRIIDEGEDDE